MTAIALRLCFSYYDAIARLTASQITARQSDPRYRSRRRLHPLPPTPAELVVLQACRQLGLAAEHEDRFFPIQIRSPHPEQDAGVSPDCHVWTDSGEVYLEVTLGRHRRTLRDKRQRLTAAAAIYGVNLRLLDRRDVDRIAHDPNYLLTLLQEVELRGGGELAFGV